MKYSIVGLLILFAACENADKGSDLSGVYITHYQNEFYAGEDTLLVIKANDGKDMYTIQRRIGVSKFGEGAKEAEKVETDNWTLEYNRKKQTLFELKQGKTLIWNEADKTLQLGNRRYKKAA